MEEKRVDAEVEKWIDKALALGFTASAPLDVSTLKVRKAVRDTCAVDKCHAYGHNWTCPPECGSLEECETAMRKYKQGFLVQTTAQLRRSIDTKMYVEAEKMHSGHLRELKEEMNSHYPEALVLGAGGCRICEKCAYPDPCRFPDKALSSMEAYGLFVTQVCRDNNLSYYYGPKTITYTGCVLF